MSATAQLRGPADADHYRVQHGRDRERWYIDPLDADETHPATTHEFPSVSGVLRASGEDWSFAAIKRIAQRLVQTIDDLADLDVAAVTKTLSAWDKDGLAAAGQRGQDTHAYIDARLNGYTRAQIEQSQMLHPSSGAHEYLPAVETFLDYYKPTLVARRSEIVVIHRDLHGYGYGGTLDALIEINGLRYLVDWKTRTTDHLIYAKEPLQAGAYGGAQYCIVEASDGRPVRAELPHLDGALIVSITKTGVRVYPIELSMAYDSFVDAHAWWSARREETKCQLHPWAPVPIGAQQAPQLSLVTSWPKERVDRLRDRIRALVENGHGPLLVEQLNMAGLPGLAKSGHTDEQLDQMQTLIERIESVTDKPFDANDTIEGANVGTSEIEAVARHMKQLTPRQRDWIVEVADACSSIRHSISLRELPSQRRFEIARALLFLTLNAWDGDRWNDALVRAAMQHAGYTWNGQLEAFGTLSSAQASEIANVAAQLGSSSLLIEVLDDGSFRVSGGAS